MLKASPHNFRSAFNVMDCNLAKEQISHWLPSDAVLIGKGVTFGTDSSCATYDYPYGMDVDCSPVGLKLRILFDGQSCALVI